jgi:hypothetical protein
LFCFGFVSSAPQRLQSTQSVRQPTAVSASTPGCVDFVLSAAQRQPTQSVQHPTAVPASAPVPPSTSSSAAVTLPAMATSSDSAVNLPIPPSLQLASEPKCSIVFPSLRVRDVPRRTFVYIFFFSIHLFFIILVIFTITYK